MTRPDRAIPIDANNDADTLAWFADWYRRQAHGVTLDVRLERHTRSGCTTSHRARLAGWRLTIELAGTNAASRRPRTLLLDSSDGSWLSCSLTHERFVGHGDHNAVEQIIAVFRRWVEPGSSSSLTLAASHPTQASACLPQTIA